MLHTKPMRHKLADTPLSCAMFNCSQQSPQVENGGCYLGQRKRGWKIDLWATECSAVQASREGGGAHTQMNSTKALQKLSKGLLCSPSAQQKGGRGETPFSNCPQLSRGKQLASSPGRGSFLWLQTVYKFHLQACLCGIFFAVFSTGKRLSCCPRPLVAVSPPPFLNLYCSDLKVF